MSDLKCVVLIFECLFISELLGNANEATPSVQTELVLLALPAIAGQAIEPLAQLMETAYIGRLGKGMFYFLFLLMVCLLVAYELNGSPSLFGQLAIHD